MVAWLNLRNETLNLENETVAITGLYISVVISGDLN